MEVVSFSAGTIKKLNELVIEILFTRDAEIDETMALEILTLINKLSNSGPHALLYDFNKKNVILAEITRKLSGVRNYNNAHLISRAMVTQNMASTFESSYYIKHDKPQAETKLFEEKEKAFAWLNQKVEAFLQT